MNNWTTVLTVASMAVVLVPAVVAGGVSAVVVGVTVRVALGAAARVVAARSTAAGAAAFGLTAAAMWLLQGGDGRGGFAEGEGAEVAAMEEVVVLPAVEQVTVEIDRASESDSGVRYVIGVDGYDDHVTLRRRLMTLRDEQQLRRVCVLSHVSGRAGEWTLAAREVVLELDLELRRDGPCDQDAGQGPERVAD